MRNLFGTDGIRGKANLFPMTGEIALSLGRAVTFYFQKKNPGKKAVIVIGKDTRVSCYMFELAIAAGVCSQGGRAILTGPLPTPGVSFATKSMRAHAGIMISASHNVYSDNGIKIFDADGNKLPDQVEAKLEELILNPQLMNPHQDESLGKAERLDEVLGRYIVHVKKTLDPGFGLEGLRVVLDCANGAGYRVGPKIFEELGAKVVSLGVSPNGRNINKNCGALYPEECSKVLLSEKADFGFCLDGDADRLKVVDEKGGIVNGDQLIGFLALYLKKRNLLGKTHEIVGTIMSNIGLENFLSSHNMTFHRTPVGDRYILERMLKSGSVFGGENSGHIIFRNSSLTGDGILAALMVAQAVNYFDKPLSELVSAVKLYPQVQGSVLVKEKPPLDKVKGLSKLLKGVKEKLKDEGRVIVRYSGTESKVRVMIEGQDPHPISKYSEEICEVLRRELS